MFINFTNHKMEFWSEKQLAVANEYGEIMEIPFPNVSSEMSAEEVVELSKVYAQKIIELNPAAVLCQGEFTLTYAIVKKLKEHNIKVIAACSERKVTECIKEDGTNEKKAIFEFVQFREYI